MEQLRTPGNMKRNGDRSKQILGKPKAKELKDIARTHQVTKTPSTWKRWRPQKWILEKRGIPNANLGPCWIEACAKLFFQRVANLPPACFCPGFAQSASHAMVSGRAWLCEFKVQDDTILASFVFLSTSQKVVKQFSNATPANPSCLNPFQGYGLGIRWRLKQGKRWRQGLTLIGFKASFQLQLWYVRIFAFRVYQLKNRLLSPSVFHPSKTAQEHCTKGNKKAKFVVLNWDKKQPGQTTEQIGLIFVQFFHVAYCVFAKWWLVGIVRHPRNKWECGWSGLQTVSTRTNLMNGQKKIVEALSLSFSFVRRHICWFWFL